MADVITRFHNDSIAQTFMTEDQVRVKCPLAFVETPTNHLVSDKYVLANTATVIRDMEQLGWKVVDARQRKAKTNASGRFSYHMVVFQNPDVKITRSVEGFEEVDCYPRIILTNSHDGLNCFKFMVGLFRLVCSNGLVIASERFADLKIRHINYSFEELRELTNKVIQELPVQVDLMTQMKNFELSREQMLDLALKMYKLRRGFDITEECEVDIDEETLEDMLDPQREEDRTFDLWTVFNVLQEKVIKGGYSYKEGDKKPRKMRKITSFVKDLDLNEKMFQVALSYLHPVEDAEIVEECEV